MIGTPPPAEIDIDEALIARLVVDQFPELAGRVRIVAAGWDNVIARLGDGLCVRMPRRALSAPLVAHEAEWLPKLASDLPVAVPAATAVGAPGRGYPWSWLVCPWFEGRALAEVAVADRVAAAAQLGTFAAALHRPAPAAAPANPWRGIPLAEYAPRVLERLDRVEADEAAVLRAAWESAVDAPPWEGPPLWLHGDLHALNLLVGRHSDQLAAVIDWGDVCAGDPATDLAIAWLAFDRSGREAFRDAAAARHPSDGPVWRRAVGWAVGLGLVSMLGAPPGSAGRRIGEHLVAELRADEF